MEFTDVITSIAVFFIMVIFAITTIFEVAWPILLPIFFISYIRKNNSNRLFKENVRSLPNFDTDRFKDVNKEDLEKLGVEDIKQFKDYLYDIFIDFENAYNNLDYNGMSNTSTPKLFNSYHTNILLNLKFGQKKIISDIKRKDVTIYNISVYDNPEKASTTIFTTIEIEYISYMQDSSGNIISGSPNPVTERFEVQFVKRQDNINTRCPNCGATVNGSVCDYCGNGINTIDYRIDSIMKIVINDISK